MYIEEDQNHEVYLEDIFILLLFMIRKQQGKKKKKHKVNNLICIHLKFNLFASILWSCWKS